MVGRDKSRRYWRVLKIDRLETSELSIREDSTTYTECECSELLRRIHEGNKSTGGLKFITTCYGIVGMYIHIHIYFSNIYTFHIMHLLIFYLFLGFIKFLGPYYMLLIAQTRPIGSTSGHMLSSSPRVK